MPKFRVLASDQPPPQGNRAEDHLCLRERDLEGIRLRFGGNQTFGGRTSFFMSKRASEIDLMLLRVDLGSSGRRPYLLSFRPTQTITTSAS
eukprot:945980-Amorphochlora_amoeboformis.AAC.1